MATWQSAGFTADDVPGFKIKVRPGYSGGAQAVLVSKDVPTMSSVYDRSGLAALRDALTETLARMDALVDTTGATITVRELHMWNKGVTKPELLPDTRMLRDVLTETLEHMDTFPDSDAPGSGRVWHKGDAEPQLLPGDPGIKVIDSEYNVWIQTPAGWRPKSGSRLVPWVHVLTGAGPLTEMITPDAAS